jgi:alkanesulfonate monooxygenase SsuD/methylene tetrahydromethanopterin reductase-like flavin-dependent oxidoreductase (luciferase family)
MGGILAFGNVRRDSQPLRLVATREKIMAGETAAASLLDLAARASRLGFDAISVGDSLFARPARLSGSRNPPSENRSVIARN